MKKKIISCAIVSILAMSSFAKAQDVSNASDSSQSEIYTYLNKQITQRDDQSSQHQFEKVYSQKSKLFEKKLTDLKNDKRYIKLPYPDNVKKEMQALDDHKIVSMLYDEQGFIDAAKTKGVDEKTATKEYQDLSMKQIMSDEQAKTIPELAYANSGSYDSIGFTLAIKSMDAEISACKSGDSKCIEDVANKRKATVSNDLFENLNNKCTDLNSYQDCRVKTLKSADFSKQLYYKNYLLGKYKYEVFSAKK